MTTTDELVTIDGSHGESGGAILRTALGLSLLTGKPFTITRIRQGRPKPGLSFQHLTALNAAHQLCDAQVIGNSIGSTEITFRPGKLKRTRLSFDIGTAGSITLFLQSFILPALFTGKEFHFTIKGGTDVRWSIPADYFANVLLLHLRPFADVSFRIARRGYYPTGGGEVLFTAKGRFPLARGAPRLKLDGQGTILKIAGVSHASLDLSADRVAERQEEGARVILSSLGAPLDVHVAYGPSSSSGSGLVLYALCGSPTQGIDLVNPVVVGASSLGDEDPRPEKVGYLAAERLKRSLASQAPCDEHLADQLIPLLAVVGGTLRTERITDHLRSNIYVAQRFLNIPFIIDEEQKTITCVGARDSLKES